MNTMLFSPTVSTQMVLVDLVNSFLVEGYISEQVIFTRQQAKTRLKARFSQCLIHYLKGIQIRVILLFCSIHM